MTISDFRGIALHLGLDSAVYLDGSDSVMVTVPLPHHGARGIGGPSGGVQVVVMEVADGVGHTAGVDLCHGHAAHVDVVTFGCADVVGLTDECARQIIVMSAAANLTQSVKPGSELAKGTRISEAWGVVALYTFVLLTSVPPVYRAVGRIYPKGTRETLFVS